jgi:hypothetical protein
MIYPNGPNDTTYETMKMSPYLNQDDPSLSIQEYKMSGYGVNGLIRKEFNSRRLAIIRDGMSNTIEITTHYANIKKQEGQKIHIYKKY